MAIYSKVANADPELQERMYVELGREPLLPGGFGRETEQVFPEFKERLHAVMWLNDRRSHKAKTHHELHLLLLEFVQKTLDANIRNRIMRESEALLAAAASTCDSVATRIIEVSPTRSPKESNEGG